MLKKLSLIVSLLFLIGMSPLSAGTITGTVTDTDGNPLPFVLVTVRYIDTPGEPTTYSNVEFSNGRYSFTSLPENDYYIKFDASGHESKYFGNSFTIDQATPVSLGSNDSKTVNIQLERFSAKLSGTLTDTNGKTLKDVLVALFIHTESSDPRSELNWRSRFHTKSDDNGNYKFEALPRGRYRIRFASNTFGIEYYSDSLYLEEATDIQLAPHQEKKFDAVLGDLGVGKIQGSVKDINGNGIKSALVDMIQIQGGEVFGEFITINTDELGNYEIANIPPGEYRMNISKNGYISEYYINSPSIEEATLINVNVGEVKKVDVGLDKIGGIRGIVKDEFGKKLDDIIVTLYKSERIINWSYSESTKTDFTGRFSFEGLQPGTYRLETSKQISFHSTTSEFYKDSSNIDDAQDIDVAINDEKVLSIIRGAPDPEQVVTVTATDAVASEKGNNVGVFTVTRTGNIESPLVVEFTLSGNNVENGIDFEQVNSPLTIPAGESSAEIIIRAIDDPAQETHNERVFLELTDSRFALGRASVLILNNGDRGINPAVQTQSSGGGLIDFSSFFLLLLSFYRIWVMPCRYPTTNRGTCKTR